MSVQGFLEVIAPNYARELDQERYNQLLAVATQYRPDCLAANQQELAVAYYMAYLIAQRIEIEANPYGVVSEREGDISRSYATAHANSARFYAKWQELSEICVRVNGAITVGLNNDGC